jgi:hypothetical protein
VDEQRVKATADLYRQWVWRPGTAGKFHAYLAAYRLLSRPEIALLARLMGWSSSRAGEGDGGGAD